MLLYISVRVNWCTVNKFIFHFIGYMKHQLFIYFNADILYFTQIINNTPYSHCFIIYSITNIQFIKFCFPFLMSQADVATTTRSQTTFGTRYTMSKQPLNLCKLICSHLQIAHVLSKYVSKFLHCL